MAVMQAEFVQHNHHEIAIKGDLKFSTITALCKQLPTVFVCDANVTVNLAQVSVCDSASLVLLLSIIERYRATDFTVSFSHIPNAILTLIRVYNLQTLITNQS
jgi:ABC-type transporter Mla MlaB component